MSHLTLFDLIAPFYAWFYNYQRKSYQKAVDLLSKHIELKNLSAIDLGCGTGALTAELSKYMSIKGIDGSANMIKEAKRLNPNLDFDSIEFKHELPFLNQSTDIVFSSFVLHGLKSPKRLELLKEMKRIATSYVIILDYHEGRNPMISLVEWIEHGDYFHFMKHFKEETEQVFKHIEILKINQHTAFYIMH
ncbi:MAG: class I SAM-dependent methyltransferase [Erysipelotrichaceae bacterium]